MAWCFIGAPKIEPHAMKWCIQALLPSQRIILTKRSFDQKKYSCTEDRL